MIGRPPICYVCSKPLTPEEAEFYGYRCDGCEAAWSVRIDRWLAGGKDAALDVQFDGPPPSRPH